MGASVANIRRTRKRIPSQGKFTSVAAVNLALNSWSSKRQGPTLRYPYIVDVALNSWSSKRQGPALRYPCISCKAAIYGEIIYLCVSGKYKENQEKDPITGKIHFSGCC